MDRLITAHALRKTCSPSPMWTLATPDEGGRAPLQTIVPGDAREIPGLRGYTGRLVYEKRITCAGTLRIILRGVDGSATLWLDDACLGACSGGRLEAITGDIEYGQHLLRVEVTGGAGIIRPVVIEQMGGAYVFALCVRPKQKGRMWLVEIAATVRSLCDENKTIDLDLNAGPAKAHAAEVTLPARGEVVVRRMIPAPGVKKWSPAKPTLYQTGAVLWLDGEPCDDLRDRFGFCDGACADGQVIINGNVLQGKIFAREESCGGFGCAAPAQAAVRDVQLLRELGACAVVAGDDPVFLDACDELGMPVLAEQQLGNHPCCIVVPAAGQLQATLLADRLDGTPGLLDIFRQEKQAQG